MINIFLGKESKNYLLSRALRFELTLTNNQGFGISSSDTINSEDLTLAYVLDYCLELINKSVSNIAQLSNIGYDNEKLEYLEDLLYVDNIGIIDGELKISDSDKAYSKSFMNVLSVMCKKSKDLVLINPDSGMSLGEIKMFVCICERMNVFFKDMYIITEDNMMLSIPNARYLIIDDYQPKTITEEEARVYIKK